MSGVFLQMGRDKEKRGLAAGSELILVDKRALWTVFMNQSKIHMILRTIQQAVDQQALLYKLRGYYKIRGQRSPSHWAPIPRSTPHNESFESIDCNNLFRQTSRKKESSINNAKNHFQEEIVEDYFLADFLNGGDRVQLLKEKKAKEVHTQLMNYEPWIPTWECTESRQNTHEMIMEAAEDEIELKGTLKRLQKLVRVRKINQNNQEDGKNILISSTNSHMQDNFMVEDSPVISCIKLPKSQDKKQVKEPLKQNQNTDLTLDFAWNSLDRPYRPKWNYQVDCSPPWGNGYHTCRRAIPEYRVYGHDFTLPRSKDWDKYEYCAHDKFPTRFTRSATDMDLYDSKEKLS
ncbi:uncharacterized protein LOC120524409 [Polypterus senegalus]|uniref:uncharacterized protein LOC120524409 n=1 Tax=Polypterus senegalus TaxID=55291 RepID=UPI001963C788|nr:uncharacterized protein LOC120524409 [Polypterus senegalus]